MTKRKEPNSAGGRAVTKEERELLETSGAKLFEYIVGHGGIPGDDPLIAADSPEHDAFDVLVKLGLLAHDSSSGAFLPVDPSIVSSQIVAPIGQRGAELLKESSAWANALSDLALSWRRSPGTKHGPFTEIHGRDTINEFLESLVADARMELLAAQPNAGRSTTRFPQVTEGELRAMARGVSIRTLYQHAARRSTPTHAYVSTVSSHGGEVRTLDEFFNRMVVVDREVVVIPSAEGEVTALVVREQSVVAYLVDIFERAWERARPFTNRELGTVHAIADEQREMTIRMLIQGHADPSAAKRLGVSPRTYAGYVADLKDEYDAQTRFQLGYAMGQRDAAERTSGGDEQR
ncbi:DUF7436 family protein [Nocardioides speluncae]|uniref:DUF7436 family protein n=1 Tax=Nocardioides speluncae TaxID=2670337 RepID=UPI000D687515|nr:LuxR family transcriptional regulator [Nocardioides speluncae]